MRVLIVFTLTEGVPAQDGSRLLSNGQQNLRQVLKQRGLTSEARVHDNRRQITVTARCLKGSFSSSWVNRVCSMDLEGLRVELFGAVVAEETFLRCRDRLASSKRGGLSFNFACGSAMVSRHCLGDIKKQALAFIQDLRILASCQAKITG